MNLPRKTAVIIAGAGPCGLMLALELGRRGVAAVVIDEKDGTAFNPQANATQARTMEHYRRLGIADEIRALGLPADYPTDIAYFTRFADHELARFNLPSSRDATAAIRTMSGSWSAAELPHRVSQKYVEQVLRRHAEAQGSISLNFGWRLTGFTQTDDGVTAEVAQVDSGKTGTITGAYLMGCDGARSLVRRALGIELSGEGGTVRDFMGGRMYAIYLRAPHFYDLVPHARAWMYVTFNRDRRAYMASVDGAGTFAFHTQLLPHEDEQAIGEDDAKAMFARAAGRDMDVEILSRRSWVAGHALVAGRFRDRRVFIGGDAAHLFTPAGGLGYNTAIEDAVNLAWKLAAVLAGAGGEALLDSYEAERRPLAVRNTGYARGFADSLGLMQAPPELEEDGPAGAAARVAAGAHFNEHARKEFDIPGVTFGGRYDASPVIAADGTPPPKDAANDYAPTARPGGRPPHLWLDGERSLYDLFGPDWTLLRLGAAPPAADGWARAARRAGVDLAVVDVPLQEASALYEADLALIRPDQMVAWRSLGAAAHMAPEAVFEQVLGRAERNTGAGKDRATGALP